MYATYNDCTYHYKCLREMLQLDSEYHRIDWTAEKVEGVGRARDIEFEEKKPHGFWQFLEKHMEKNLLIQAFILYLQIPHMVWVGDLFVLRGKIFAGLHGPLDWLLFGVDWIEWIAIINVTLLVIARLKVRRKK